MQERIERIVAIVAAIVLVGGMAFISITNTPVVWAQQPPATVTPVPATPSPTSQPTQPSGNSQQGFLGIAVEESGGSVVVRQVEGNSPADQAGIRGGDVITAVDGQAITSVQQLADLIQQRQPGSTITLQYTRNGQPQEVTVTLGTRPQPQSGQQRRPSMGFALPFSLPGLEGIPPAQLFDHLRGGTLELTDRNGNPLTVEINPGRITAVATDTVTLQLNGGGTKTFRITPETAGLRAPNSQGSTAPLTQGLSVGEPVVVLSQGNTDTALVILRTYPRLGSGTSDSRSGQGQGSSRSFVLPLPNGSGTFRFYSYGEPLPPAVQELLEQMRQHFEQGPFAWPDQPDQPGQPM